LFLPEQLVSSEALLEAAVNRLGFTEGELFKADSEVNDNSREQWLDKGDWLALAKSVGAERVFFVEQNPVVVFARLDDASEDEVRAFYNRIWCMARPQLLFLARPGELAIYDLGKAPIRPGEKAEDKGRLLSEKIRVAGDVQAKLAQFRREEIESGRLWEDLRFGRSTDRADRALIRDLRVVRKALLSKGLKARYAHSLIGRSIFIRYLEDREVLVPEYFHDVATKRKSWSKILTGPGQRPFAESDLANLCFPRVLEDRDFTYALFDRLARDFNGDIFPVDEDEREKVGSEHLALLRGLLLGETSEQRQLFFFAYRFDVIPIELISSIYEEFYNEEKGKDKNHGSHYTPSTLVEFILSRTLTPEVLERSPRVTDFACGSGIFLVESFRRIVRHQVRRQNGKRLSRPQLRKILRDQIAGIDINEEAVRVAAFSLYLAFLHYQEPREINEQRRLPNLKWSKRAESDGDQHFDILLHENAFCVVGEKTDPAVARRFGAQSADVVVGNPPWGSPKNDDQLGRSALRRTIEWSEEKRGRTIGDKEWSQAFIHLALELVRNNGVVGLLVSSGVLFKHHQKSQEFRRIWLSNARLEHVVNFAQVRHLFFRGEARKTEAIAPFVATIFKKEVPGPDNRFAYWSAKRTAFVETSQAVVLSRGDMHWLQQADCVNDERLWKIYWWGSHRDEALVRSVERFPRLIDLPDKIPGARVTANIGFVEGKTGQKRSGWLREFKELPVEWLERYTALPLSCLCKTPGYVRRRGTREAYEGHRLLVRRGIPGTGRITARLETRRLSFRHSIFAIRLIGFESWQEKTILGIFWSSLARYYLFLTTGSWGMWHDELNMEIAQGLPIALPGHPSVRARLVNIVDRLQGSSVASDKLVLRSLTAEQEILQLERELDDVIFDLYDLNTAERDLIRDMCDVGMDFLYNGKSSSAVKPVLVPAKTYGVEADVLDSQSGMGAYLKTFLQIWNQELDADTELSWHLLSPDIQAPLVAVLFSAQAKIEPVVPSDANNNWAKVLTILDKSSLQTAGSRQIYTDSFVRLVNEEDEILLIKRNEVRFWTPSAAREDAEATQLQAMRLQEAAAL
jgi:hypothetical protein